MKFSERPTALVDAILRVTKREQSDAGLDFIDITQAQYNELFWQLLQQKPAQSNNKLVPLAEALLLLQPLHQYVVANRQQFGKALRLKNPARIKRPKPPLREVYAKWLPLLDRLDGGFLNGSLLQAAHHEDIPQGMPWALHMGQLMFSACRYGGLLRQDLLTSLFQTLCRGSLHQKDQLCWFELTSPTEPVHIWLPDPVTLALTIRWLKAMNAHSVVTPLNLGLNWFQCLKSFLRASGYSELARLRTNTWLRLITARLSLTHTPCHLPAMTGEGANFPLEPACFYRWIGAKHTGTLDMTPRDEDRPSMPDKLLHPASVPLDSTESDCRATIKQVKQWLEQAHKGQTTKSNVAELCKERAESTSVRLLPITRLLLEWAAKRLMSQSAWSGKLSPATLKTYLGSLYPVFSRLIAARCLLRLTLGDRDELYHQIVDEAPTAQSRLKRARMLRDFDVFLERNYQLPASYVCSLWIVRNHKDNRLPMVDATILFPMSTRPPCITCNSQSPIRPCSIGGRLSC